MVTDRREPPRRIQWPALLPCPDSLLQRLLRIGVFLLALLLAGQKGHALEEQYDWDQQFPYPVYVVHITKTSTLSGPVDNDRYALSATAPDQNGILLTADGYGGWFINEAELVGGTYSTPRQVCNAVKGTPAQQFDMREVPQLPSIPCDELYCTEECGGASGLQIWDRQSSYPECGCICKKGYSLRTQKGGFVCVPCDEICQQENEDAHLVFDTVNSVANICECRCEDGYDNRYSEKCEAVACPDHAENMASLQDPSAPYALVCPRERKLSSHCCCKAGYVPWGSTCQKPVEIPGDRGMWRLLKPQNVGANELEAALDKKDYTHRVVTEASYRPASLPVGTVTFWAVDGTNQDGGKVHNEYAHCSIVVNEDGDQLEMAADAVQAFQAGKPPGRALAPHLASGKYVPHLVWEPPAGGKVKPTAGRLVGMPRGHIVKQSAGSAGGTEWNCHGFVKTVAESFCAVPDPAAPLPARAQFRSAQYTPMKDPPGMPFALELHQGAIYGQGLELDVFLPSGFVELTDEFLVEVNDAGTAEIHVFRGHADYYPYAPGDAVRVSEEQRLVAQAGLPSAATSFDVAALEQWWERGEGSPGDSRWIGAGVALVTAAALLILAAGALIVWPAARRRRLAATGGPAIEAGIQPRQWGPAKGRAAEPGGAWATLAVTQGQAPPKVVHLDRPVLTIGRGSGSDLVLRDSLISRRHAQIRRTDGEATIHDLASTNGTFVNGARVSESHRLHPGDVIRLGSTELIFGARTSHHLRAATARRPSHAVGRSSRIPLVLNQSVLTIGRGSDSDLVLPDGLVSRRHAQVRDEGGRTVLYDLNSSNGTFVNGQRIASAHVLEPGDVIRVGQTELVFEPGSLRSG